MIRQHSVKYLLRIPAESVVSPSELLLLPWLTWSESAVSSCPSSVHDFTPIGAVRKEALLVASRRRNVRDFLRAEIT